MKFTERGSIAVVRFSEDDLDRTAHGNNIWVSLQSCCAGVGAIEPNAATVRPWSTRQTIQQAGECNGAPAA